VDLLQRACAIWPPTVRFVGRAWHVGCLASSGMDVQMYDFVVEGGGSTGRVAGCRLPADVASAEWRRSARIFALDERAASDFCWECR
jgi:hypothetical protein